MGIALVFLLCNLWGLDTWLSYRKGASTNDCSFHVRSCSMSGCKDAAPWVPLAFSGIWDEKMVMFPIMLIGPNLWGMLTLVP